MYLFIFYCVFSYLFMAGAIIREYKKPRETDLFDRVFWLFSPLTLPFYLGFSVERYEE